MSKRVLLAGLFHETNTFVDHLTSLDDFRILHGEEMLRCQGDSSPLGGVLDSAQAFGWTVLPVIDFRASPSGVVEDEVVETFWREFRQRSEPELAAGVAGIYLVLHGAMVSQTLDDVEGEILERIRSLPGARALPIFGVFDLHANFTQRMAAGSNGLVAYRENPHTDARHAAQFAAALLDRSLRAGAVPKTFWRHPPLIWPPTGTGTADDPMRSLQTLARRIEADFKDIWSVNVMAGFSYADVPEAGVSFSLVTTGAESEALTQLDRLCAATLQSKEQGNVMYPPIAAVLPKLLPLPPGLTVLVEPSDNIGAGAPGDGTGALRALLKHGVTNAAVAIQDPAAVAALSGVGPRAKTTLPIGGKGNRLDAGPLILAVELISQSDGRFRLEDSQSHLASMSGDTFDMGPCAVVRHEGVLILLTSRKTPPFDLGQWRSQGIEPTQLSLLVVKAAVAHRRAYDPIAARMLWVDTPGPCSSDLTSLPYRRVRRPIYPLDLP